MRIMKKVKRGYFQSSVNGNLILIVQCSLFVLLFIFFPFISNCVSVEGSVFNKAQLESLTSPCLLQEEEEKRFASDQETVHRITVLGHVAWTDTGLEMEEGQEINFNAWGLISIQKGNPIGFCGPDGYPLKMMQQPISDQNIGALIGKVVLLISIEIDEDTDREIRHEIGENFFLGAENKVRMPMKGRLFLGINENVVGDNSGEFTVDIIYFPFISYPL